MALASAQPTETVPSAGSVSVAPPRSRFQKKLRASFKAYLFIAPAMILLFVFNFFPIIYAFFLSLYTRISVVNGIIPPAENFGGLSNYGQLLSDPDWWNAFFNTLGYVVGVLVLGIGASLGVSLMLDRVKKGKELYRVAFFLPYITSLVAVATVWYVIFSPYATNALAPRNTNQPGGLANWLFSSLGIPMQRWLLDDTGIFHILFFNGKRFDLPTVLIRLVIMAALIGIAVVVSRRLNHWISTLVVGLVTVVSVILGWSTVVEIAHTFDWSGWAGGPSIAMIAVIIVSVWYSLGFNIVILLAGLSNISRDFYEAARIDGAKGWAMFRNITVPLLSPTLFFLVVVTTISSFQAFTLFFAIVPGGAPRSLTVLSLFYYDVTFLRGSGSATSGYGYSSTIVIFMVILIILINQVQQRLLSSKVTYD